MTSLKFTGLLGLLFVSAVFNLQAAGCVHWEDNAFGPQKPFAKQITPNSGIYWFKNTGDDKAESVAPACKISNDPHAKAACMNNLQKTGYFDPHKPTIIFVHGWQPFTVVNKNRFDFCYKYATGPDSQSETYNTLSQWKDWNVGVFYWNQFSDEMNVIEAEAKIYSTNGAKKMRWRYRQKNLLNDKYSAKYCTAANDKCVMPTDHSGEPMDVVQMAYQAYIQAMPKQNDYFAHQVRITGQSLGTQIAIQLTGKLLYDAQGAPEPTRLGLMDPFFSADNSFTKANNLPDSVADFNANVIANILQVHPGFPITVYRTSDLSQAPTGNPAETLNNQVAFMQLFPSYMYADGDSNLQAAKHKSSIYLYFYSKHYTPQPTSDIATDYLTAASTDLDVINLMRKKRYQVTDPKLSDFSQFWLSHFKDVKPEE